MMKEEIYPEIWDGQDNEAIEYLCEYFDLLKQYIHTIAEKDMGLLVGMS